MRSLFFIFILAVNSYSFAASDMKNSYVMASEVQVLVVGNIIKKNISIYRPLSILLYCDEDKHFFKYNKSKDVVVSEILEELTNVGNNSERLSSFLLDMQEGEKLILVSGIYNELAIYNKGFIDSLEYNSTIGAIDKGRYCEALVPVAIDILDK